ncbi:MAG: PAS domain-containing protein, partial [Microcystaceae cyanobacterium]
FQRALSEQTPIQFEYLYLTWNRWYEHRVYPSSDGLTVFVAEITERKQAELMLVEQKRLLELSEERLSLAIEGADMVTWDADLQTGKTIWSANHFCILGYEPVASGEAAIAMWQSRVHPDDLESVMQAWEIAQRERSLYNPEYRIIRADNGQVVWLGATGRFLYDQAGQAVRFVGICFDITNRKQAEAALVESQQRLQAIVNAIPHAIWVLGANGEFRFSNQQWLNYYGVPFPEAMATGWRQLPPDDLEAVQQRWQMAMADGIPYETEFRWCFADSSERWYLCRAEPIRNESGQIVEWVGTNTDITHLKRVEADWQESQRFMQQVTETLPGLLYVYDLIEQRNVYINRQVLELLGYTPEQLQAMGSDITPNMVHPDDLPGVMAHLAAFNTAQPGEVLEFEHRAKHANGEWRWLFSRSLVFNRTLTGDAQQILGVSFDITDRKQAEAALQQREAELRLVTNAVPALISFVDSDQRYRFNNRAYEEWFGHPATEVYG